MAELTRDDDDDKVTAYRDTITTWVDSAGGRDLDRMAKGQLRDVAARLSFATSKGRDELRLPSGEAEVDLVLTTIELGGLLKVRQCLQPKPNPHLHFEPRF